MKADELERAIASRDPWAIADVLSTWTEADRDSVRLPLNILMLAAGRRHLCDPGFDRDAYREQAEAKSSSLDPTFADGDYDKHHGLNDLFDLALLGLRRPPERLHTRFGEHDSVAARIMIDRRPHWMQEWIESGTRAMDRHFWPVMWMLLREEGLVQWSDSITLQQVFEHQFPEACESEPALSQRLLREESAAADLIYKVPTHRFMAFNAKRWHPIMKWMDAEGLLDRGRLVRESLKGIRKFAKAKDDHGARVGAVGTVTAIKATASELLPHQTELIKLLGDSTPVVVGYAIAELTKLSKLKKFHASKTLDAIPNAFSLSAKSHVLKAVKLIDLIARDQKLRLQAIDTLMLGLNHPNVDVQSVSLDRIRGHGDSLSDEQVSRLKELQATISPTLKAALAELVESHSGVFAETDDADQGAGSTDQMIDEFSKRAADIDPATAKLLRIDQAIDAARRGDIDLRSSWPLMSGGVLASSELITPITDVEELIDAVSTAGQEVRDPDLPDQIMDAIVRLFDDRVDDFEKRTESLYAFVKRRPEYLPARSLFFGPGLSGFRILVKTWLRDNGKVTWRSGELVTLFAEELATKVSVGRRDRLLSTPTHRGGWIDPAVWIERLQQLSSEVDDIDELDLVRSLLRLAPDRRGACLPEAEKLPMPYRAWAVCRLGGPVDWKAAGGNSNVWVAACRSRDPLISIPREAAFAKDLDEIELAAPDSRWRLKPGKPTDGDEWIESAWGGLVDLERREVLAELKAKHPRGDYRPGYLTTLAIDAAIADRDHTTGIYTSLLLRLHPWMMPDWYDAFVASLWPGHLDWYFFLGARCLLQRVDRNNASNDRPDGFLLPLMQQDRPLTAMAARTLWIATASKDENSRATSTDVWIALVDDDRADIDLLAEAFSDVESGGWLVYARIASVMTDVGAVSPLHAWAATCVIDRMLLSLDPWPRDVVKLLEPVLQFRTKLCLAVDEPLAARMVAIKGGKARKLANQMSGIASGLPPDRIRAGEIQLETRITRGERFTGARRASPVESSVR